MNEIKVVIVGLIALVIVALSLWVLDEPEIIKQNGKYGIRLRASAPSIHMMKTQIRTRHGFLMMQSLGI